MPKTREYKEKLVEDLSDKLNRAKSAVLIDYKGLKVSDSEELRKILREKSVTFNVTKNTLLKIALTKSGIELDPKVFEKPLALAFAFEDEVVPAREIVLFAKDHEAIEIVGGILDRGFIDEDMIRKLASLPSKEELYAKIVGSISSPLRGMVNVLSGNIRGLVNVLSQYQKKIS